MRDMNAVRVPHAARPYSCRSMQMRHRRPQNAKRSSAGRAAAGCGAHAVDILQWCHAEGCPPCLGGRCNVFTLAAAARTMASIPPLAAAIASWLAIPV